MKLAYTHIWSKVMSSMMLKVDVNLSMQVRDIMWNQLRVPILGSQIERISSVIDARLQEISNVH